MRVAHDSMACTSHQATALADSRTVTAAAMPSTSSPAGDQSGVRGLDALVTQLRMLRAQANEAQSLAAQLEAELADRKQCVWWCGCGCGCGCQTALPLTTSRRCRFAAESKRKTSLVATFQARRCRCRSISVLLRASFYFISCSIGNFKLTLPVSSLCDLFNTCSVWLILKGMFYICVQNLF